jgi:hypothetical protein
VGKYLILLVTTFLVLGVMLSDGYFLPGRHKSVIVERKLNKYTSLRAQHYYNYFIITSDSCKYEVDSELFAVLAIDDSVAIISSRLLHMPLSLHYFRNNKDHFCNIGQLRTYTAERIAIILCFSITTILIALFLIKPIQYSDRLVGLIGFTSFASLLLFFTVIAEIILVYHSS